MALVHRVGWDRDFVRRNGWLWPLARASAHLAQHKEFPALDTLDRLYAEEAGARGAPPLRFRPDVRDARHGAARGALEARYDARIALHGQVPTRARHWHDLLNALCFATFPHAKHALHKRQYRALVRLHGRPQRSKEQDALTLFDEGGIAIAARADAASALCAALDSGDLDALARAERDGAARIVPFGHALFEHMVEGVPCPGGAARVLALDALPCERDALLEAVDRALAAELMQPDRFVSSREALHLRLDALTQPSSQRRRAR